MELLIGTDPELFVKHGRKFISGHGLIPGTKEAPYAVANGAVQVDGMALEFNTDPASSEEEFVGNVTSVLNQLRAMVPDYVLVPTPVAKFSKELLKSQPKEALELGCDPDFNAYTGEANPQPNAEGIQYRTGAGHIHIGWCEGVDITHPEHLEACRMMAQQLDYYVGLTSFLWDDNFQRRSLYGKAGAFRPKSYGMEYRTLSNAWLTDDKLIGWVYRAVVKAAEDLAEGSSMFNSHGSMAQHIIDNCPESSKDIAIAKAKCMCKIAGFELPYL